MNLSALCLLVPFAGLVWLYLDERSERRELEQRLAAVNKQLQEALDVVAEGMLLQAELAKQLVAEKNKVEELLLQFNFPGEPWTIG